MDDQPSKRRAVFVDFNDFVAATHRRLIRFADLLCGDRGRAEDLVQEAFVKIYLAWPRVRSTDPEAYARKIIVHANIDWWRRKPWREISTDLPPERMSTVDIAADLARRDEVLRLLAVLTGRERAVVVLRHYCDLSEVDVARELGCAVGTVKSANARAVSKMKRLGPDREEARS
jgi:RNA polymerase sigma-70 factor (sigma-E family)